MHEAIKELTEAKIERDEADRKFKTLERAIISDPDVLMELVNIGAVRVDYSRLKTEYKHEQPYGQR